MEEVAFVPKENLVEIEGFDEAITNELRERARNYLKERDDKLNSRRSELGVSDELLEMPHITLDHLVTLGEGGVKSLDDLADLASDELREILGVTTLNEEQANETIMAARAHWFDDEPIEEPPEDAGQEEAEQGDAAEDAPAKKTAKEVADDSGEKNAD